jgi:hypothetical protein
MISSTQTRKATFACSQTCNPGGRVLTKVKELCNASSSPTAVTDAIMQQDSLAQKLLPVDIEYLKTKELTELHDTPLKARAKTLVGCARQRMRRARRGAMSPSTSAKFPTLKFVRWLASSHTSVSQPALLQRQHMRGCYLGAAHYATGRSVTRHHWHLRCELKAMAAI